MPSPTRGIKSCTPRRRKNGGRFLEEVFFVFFPKGGLNRSEKRVFFFLLSIKCCFDRLPLVVRCCSFVVVLASSSMLQIDWASSFFL